MATTQRSNSSTAYYGLQLNAASMGLLESFEGGNATADVMVEPPGAAASPASILGTSDMKTSC